MADSIFCKWKEKETNLSRFHIYDLTNSLSWILAITDFEFIRAQKDSYSTTLANMFVQTDIKARKHKSATNLQFKQKTKVLIAIKLILTRSNSLSSHHTRHVVQTLAFFWTKKTQLPGHWSKTIPNTKLFLLFLSPIAPYRSKTLVLNYYVFLLTFLKVLITKGKS